MEITLAKLGEGDMGLYEDIYKRAYDLCASYVLNNKGTAADAEDTFQEAIVVLCVNARQADFKLTSKIETYLYGITKNLWRKKLAQKARSPVVGYTTPTEAPPSLVTDGGCLDVQ